MITGICTKWKKSFRVGLLALAIGIFFSMISCRVDILPKDIDKKVGREIDAGQYEEALDDLNTMERFDMVVDMGWVHAERGYVYMKQGKYDAAVDEISDAILLNSKDATLFNNRAFSYEKLGEFAKAESDYTRAVSLEPENARRYTERGAFYFNVGRLEESLLDIEQAIASDPLEPENFLRRADTRIRLKQIDKQSETIADLRRVLQLQPSGSLHDAAVSRLVALGFRP